MAKSSSSKTVVDFTHDAKRKNISAAEQQSIVQQEIESSRKMRYPCNTDLDPQLVWRGKDEQNWSDLVAPRRCCYDTERHLLYVACTRARDDLLVTGTLPVSEFLDDLQDGSQAGGNRG